MNYKAHAFNTMLNAIVKDTFLRTKQWFRENPNEPYCYWAYDEFISIADKDNKELLKKHKEIEDINDHTIVQWDSSNNTLILSKFCPRLKKCIHELYSSGVTQGDVNGYHWVITSDNDNFKVLCYEN